MPLVGQPDQLVSLAPPCPYYHHPKRVTHNKGILKILEIGDASRMALNTHTLQVASGETVREHMYVKKLWYICCTLYVTKHLPVIHSLGGINHYDIIINNHIGPN